MSKPIAHKSVTIIQDMQKAISVMHTVGMWLQENGKNPSKWWKPENLNETFLLQYAKPNEFYVAFVNDIPAAAVIIQESQNSQDWGDTNVKESEALYIHWLCVKREFAGKGLPQQIVDFANTLAKQKHKKYLRADTNAKEMKLRKIYETLGFDLVGVKKEDYRETALYQKSV